MKHNDVFFYLIFVVALLTSCWQDESIEPASPSIMTDTSDFRKPSTITIPVEVNLKPFLDSAEGRLPLKYGSPKYNEQFGSGGSDACPDGISCGYEVSRTALAFNMLKNVITTKATIGYWIACQGRRPCKNGPVIRFGCEDRHAGISLSTAITIDSDWTCKVKTTNNGASVQDSCGVGPFGLINVTDKILLGFNNASEIMARKMDETINGNLKTKEKVEEFWKKLNTPIPIMGKGWLYLCPTTIKVSPPILQENKAKFSFFFNGEPKLYFGEQPSLNTRPLPANDTFGTDNSMNISLPITLDDKFVTDQLERNFQLNEGGLRYPSQGSKYLTITEIKLYGYGRKVAVKVAFTGQKNGYAYLIGTPALDTASNILTFPDLTYSLETKSVILKAIDFFSHDSFVSDLRKRLKINLTSKIALIRNSVNDALNKKYNDFTLQGTIKKISVLGIYSDPKKTSTTMYFEMNGAVAVSVF